MKIRKERLGLAVRVGVLVAMLAAGASAADRPRDPATVIPMEMVAPERRDEVAEIIKEHSFYRKGDADTFPCNPRIYLSLLNEPALTLALWQDLSTNPARLQQIGPNLYQGTDGNGTTATWEFVLRSPRLHVLFCNLDYVGPRGNTKLKGRIVMIVRSGFYKEVAGDPWVQHTVEAYVKIDSKGWRAVAATVRPLIERLLEDQVEEAGWFVSLMGRLVETYPDWATGVAQKQAHIPQEARGQFRDVLTQTRRPNASKGRPTVVEAANLSSPPETVRR